MNRLLSDASAEARADTAAKVAGEFETGALSESERAIAEEIFRVMAKDVEVLVRETLSESIRDIPDVSSDIARVLAEDENDSVALPILEFSKALSDEDLVDIIDTCAPNRHVAIAQREEVSTTVSEAIVDKGDEDAVVALVSNSGAEIKEQTFDKVVDKYGESERVQAPLVKRETLPLTVAERLVTKVSDSLKEYLVTHHELSPEVASDLLLESRERAVVRLLSGDEDHPDVGDLVKQMDAHGRLSASIILRALCTGDLSFFESAMAHKAEVALHNARLLIHDDGGLGMKALYEKAALPDRLYPAFRGALDIAKISEEERSDSDPDWRSRLIMERVLTQFEDAVDFDSEDVEYLLGRLARTVEGSEHRQAAS
ncbi:MAG: DUF2336 domain-containing protein [Alphaproteobacteria bacterium]|nr:DUF2336 domain-containing protein [Alphaproteobacteria bacterium]